MTQRERNRLREHAGGGHGLTEHERNPWLVPGYAPGDARRYTCLCGWSGWMRAGLAAPARTDEAT